MPYCIVPYCKSSSKKGNHVFHQFPTDELLKFQWQRAISRQGWKRGIQWYPSQYDCICEKHFTPEDYKTNTKIKILESTAVPSVFNQYLKKDCSTLVSNEKLKTPCNAETMRMQLTMEQRLQLEEQLRMFVQLLTQFYLLSLGIPPLQFINKSSFDMLEEIKEIASSGVTSFNAHNLDEALSIVKDFKSIKDKSVFIRANFPMELKKRSSHTLGISHKIKKTLYTSKVFMYPELLPKCGITIHKGEKCIFSPAEDCLIALGLERFSSSSSAIYDIQKNLLACKTPKQISMRIKNSKRGCAPDNPIKYYYKHEVAPTLPKNVKWFNPNDVKAPKDHPFSVLPIWASCFDQNVKNMPTEEKTNKKNEPKKYRLLLPRVVPSVPFPCINISDLPNNKGIPLIEMTQLSVILPESVQNMDKNCIVNQPTVDSKFHSNVTNKKMESNLNSNGILLNDKLITVSDTNTNASYFHKAVKVVLFPETHLQDVCNTAPLMNDKVTNIVSKLPVVLPKPVHNTDKSSIVNLPTVDNKLHSNVTNKTMKSNLNSNGFLLNDKLTDTDTDENHFNKKAKVVLPEINPQDVCNTAPLMKNMVLTDKLEPKRSGFTIRSEVIGDSRKPHVCILSGSNTVIESNALHVAHYKTSKRRKIKTENSGKNSITSESACTFSIKQENISHREKNIHKCSVNDKDTKTSESVSDSNTNYCYIPLKQEIIDNTENSSGMFNVTCMMKDNSTKSVSDIHTNDCNISVKSEAIDDSVQDVCHSSNAMNQESTGVTRSMIKSNALQIAHFKYIHKKKGCKTKQNLRNQSYKKFKRTGL